jgi:DNA-binding XRE family transcriptional regulator
VDIAAALQHIYDELASLDPLQRVEAGGVVYTELLEAQARVAGLRRAAIRELRADGWLQKEIAEALGMTAQRVAQLEQGYGRAERNARKARN